MSVDNVLLPLLRATVARQTAKKLRQYLGAWPASYESLVALMEAKEHRDILRQEILREVAQLPDLPLHIRALLDADAKMTTDYELATAGAREEQSDAER